MSNAQTPSQYDCVVIGAGHNGLICATLLARAGRSVLVLEAGAQVGGAAITREFAPGFKVSAGAHLLHLMPAELLRTLKLESHGLQWAGRQLPTTALIAGAPPLTLSDGASAQGLSTVDAAAFGAYQERMRRFAAAIAPIFSSIPPRLGTNAWSDRLSLLRMAWQVRKLGRRDMRELLRIGGMNVYDLLEEHFDSAALKGALGFDAVLGANFGPRSPGTVLTLLYRLAAESAAGNTGLSQPKGGMGALCDALAKAALAAGAVVRTDSAVGNILVEADRACGVVLQSGERIGARQVISNADPKTTFLKLLGTAHLDAGFVRRVSHTRCRGLAAKLHLALNRPPPFVGLTEAALRGRLLLAPTLQHIEHAYNHTKYGEFSASPTMEITVPSINDPTLAPPGKHVLSAIVQYAPYALNEGWEAGRQRFLETSLNALEILAPGLRDCIVAAEVATPQDMEKQFGNSGGHWHHGDLAFDQILMVRPVPGAAQYRTPIEGLFLCGAGCHPGGGVMGIAGRNAAQQVLNGQHHHDIMTS